MTYGTLESAALCREIDKLKAALPGDVELYITGTVCHLEVVSGARTWINADTLQELLELVIQEFGLDPVPPSQEGLT